MPEAVIFDYGVGNLLSLKTALEKAGLTASIGTTAQDLAKADAIALPGVGSFTAASDKLDAVKETLQTKIKEGTPLLGICLGLQLFFESSEEGPGTGLALFKGRNMQLPSTVKVPHMGWNTLNIVKQNELFDGIAEGTYVYFVHSLYPVPQDKSNSLHNNRVRNNLHLSHSQQKYLRHPVPPGKIRRNRPDNS